MHGRKDLIRIPSCKTCNGNWSEIDEKFRLLTGLWAADASRKLFEESALGLKKRPTWREEIRKNSFWRPWSNDYQVRLPSGAFEPMIERIARALYWYEYGVRLDAALPIRTYFLRSLQPMENLFADMARRNIGEGQFIYAFNRYEPRPTCSTWIFIFHRRLFGGATTDDTWIREMRAKTDAERQEPTPKPE